MVAAAAAPSVAGPPPELAPPSSAAASSAPEQRLVLRDVGWKEYVIMRELMDGPGLRMTYLEGALELMTPSPDHELWKKNIARLIEYYAILRDIDLRGYGSTTFKKEARQRGAEPDECYLIGKALADVPELVIEVLHTTPLLNKLDVYAGLGVAEVWLFKDGRFRLHALDEATGAYQEIARSRFLPDLDVTMIARYAVRSDTPQALREMAAELHGG